MAKKSAPKTFRELRAASGLKQEDAARSAGLSVRTLVRLEQGSPASLATLRKLAPLYGVSLEKLIAMCPSTGAVAS
jgi:transcriptional regulator with XRE-family HTH domain